MDAFVPALLPDPCTAGVPCLAGAQAAALSAHGWSLSGDACVHDTPLIPEKSHTLTVPAAGRSLRAGPAAPLVPCRRVPWTHSRSCHRHGQHRAYTVGQSSTPPPTAIEWADGFSPPPYRDVPFSLPAGQPSGACCRAARMMGAVHGPYCIRPACAGPCHERRSPHHLPAFPGGRARPGHWTHPHPRHQPGYRRRPVRRHSGGALAQPLRLRAQRAHAALHPGIRPDPVRLHHRQPGGAGFLCVAAAQRAASQRGGHGHRGTQWRAGGGPAPGHGRAVGGDSGHLLRRGHQHALAGGRAADAGRAGWRAGHRGDGHGLCHCLPDRHSGHPVHHVADPAGVSHRHRRRGP